MKSSVSAFIMFVMVLGFMINAFAGDPVTENLNSRISSLIPQGSPYVGFNGTTEGGRSCDVGVEKLQDGSVSVSVMSGGMMGDFFIDFQTRKVKVTGVSDQGFRIIVQSLNQNGEKQMLVLNLSTQGQQQRVNSVEFLEERSSLFTGTKMKSVIKCG